MAIADMKQRFEREDTAEPTRVPVFQCQRGWRGWKFKRPGCQGCIIAQKQNHLTSVLTLYISDDNRPADILGTLGAPHKQSIRSP